jgi:hypothetical protein
MDFSSLIISITAIVISVVAVAVSIITFDRRQKSDEFRIALDIHNKLEQLVNEIIVNKDNSRNRRSKSLEYLDTWEYFAFLVNNKEIKNHNIYNFFKKSLCDETRQVFQEYPDIANNDKSFEEVKGLRKKWSCQN